MLRDRLRLGVKVYGPYTRKQDGRQHVILWDGTSRRTASYPKWLVEQRSKQLLEDGDTVDHKNRDFTDNHPSNLQVLGRAIHASLDAARAVPLKVICAWCGRTVTQRRSDYNGNRRQGKAGPFCSRTCSGKYGAAVQHGCVKYAVPDQVPLRHRKLRKTD
jgi:hypothetical protein